MERKNGKDATKVEFRVQNLNAACKMWNSFTKREGRFAIDHIRPWKSDFRV